MKWFKLSALVFILLTVFTGCEEADKTSQKNNDICPTCNMHIEDSKLYTTSLHVKETLYTFDDIGCMIIFSKKNQFDLEQMDAKVFTNDTKKYINSYKAYYKTDEKTPMGYGFAAFEKEEPNTIMFDEVIIKFLRGEHMANPKIRKQALGSKS